MNKNNFFWGGLGCSPPIPPTPSTGAGLGYLGVWQVIGGLVFVNVAKS